MFFTVMRSQKEICDILLEITQRNKLNSGFEDVKKDYIDGNQHTWYGPIDFKTVLFLMSRDVARLQLLQCGE